MSRVPCFMVPVLDAFAIGSLRSSATRSSSAEARIEPACRSHSPENSHIDKSLLPSLANSPPRSRRKTVGEGSEHTLALSATRASPPKEPQVQLQVPDGSSTPSGVQFSKLLEQVLRERPHLNLTGKVARHDKATSGPILGGFADIYKGTYVDGQRAFDVAIKQVRWNLRSTSEKTMKVRDQSAP